MHHQRFLVQPLIKLSFDLMLLRISCTSIAMTTFKLSESPHAPARETFAGTLRQDIHVQARRPACDNESRC